MTRANHTATEYLENETAREELIAKLQHQEILQKGKAIPRRQAVGIVENHYGCDRRKAVMIIQHLVSLGCLRNFKRTEESKRATFVRVASTRPKRKIVARQTPMIRHPRTNFRRGPDKGDAPVLEIGRVEIKVYDKMGREIHAGTNVVDEGGNLVIPLDPRKWNYEQHFLPLYDVDPEMHWAIVGAIRREFQRRRQRN